jgi:tetratricopeptide (TPR) repeat protein
MASDDRRRGLGFGDQRRVDGGHADDELDATRNMQRDELMAHEDDDSLPPATRAMDVVGLDDDAPATRQVAAPARPRPAPRPRPAARPAPPLDDDDDEAPTRMLDLNEINAGVAAPPAPAPRLRPIGLRIVQGPDRGKTIEVGGGTSLVGRGLDNTIVLADPAVSRKHFQLERAGDEVSLVDLGGANGTNVNGGRVHRHMLQAGDQIEVGTTVLEVQIEGVARRRASSGFEPPAAPPRPMQPVSGAPVAARQPAQRAGGGPWKMIAIAVAAVLVLAGGGAAAFFLLGDDKPGAPAAGEADESGAPLEAALGEARDLMADGRFGDAVDVLRKARRIDRKNPDVRKMLRRARAEVDAAEALDEAQDMVREKRYLEAIKLLGSVEEESASSAEARDELAAARELYVGEQLTAARKAMDEGAGDVARAALKAVLAVDPKNAEARLLDEQFAEGTAPAGEDKDEAKGVDAKPAARAPSRPRPERKPPPGKASAGDLLRSGEKAYHNRKWSAAELTWQRVVKGPYDKGDKANAERYLKALKAVSPALSGVPARPGVFAKAYRADQRIDGHFGTELAKKAGDAYVAQARRHLNTKAYGAAARAVREALNFTPESAEAARIEEACSKQADPLLKSAQRAFDQGDYMRCIDLAGQVRDILPSMDPRAADARKLLKKANDARMQDDD